MLQLEQTPPQRPLWAHNLQHWRTQAGLEIEQLAQQLQVPPHQVLDWEAARCEPGLHHSQALLKRMGTSLDHWLHHDLSLTAPDHLTGPLDLRALVLDVDGTLTDGGMYLSEQGDELKKFNAKDGLALTRLARQGVRVGLLSSGTAMGILQRRTQMLGLHWCSGEQSPKLPRLQAWLEGQGLNLKQCAYVGDDVNDLPLFDHLGLVACPADAAAPVRARAHVVLPQRGGDGCVRAFVERFFLNIE